MTKRNHKPSMAARLFGRWGQNSSLTWVLVYGGREYWPHPTKGWRSRRIVE